MRHQCIYIADDDDNIREGIKIFLENDGFEVAAFENGDKLYASFLEKESDLVILDISMPGNDGFEICKRIRSVSTVPIIILSARDSEFDYAKGISLGSDDYFTKPFSPTSLTMRVKAIFRRIEFEKQKQLNDKESVLSYGDIRVDSRTKSAVLREKNLELTPNEFEVLKYLIENQERAVSRSELLTDVWGYNSDIETRVTDDTVRRLRKKIDSSKVKIEAVWGYGFRLKDEA